MNRWGVRIAGLIMLLFFAFVFFSMYKQFEAIQQRRNPAATSTR